MTQDQALSILKTGANVFLTGEPGSGKTHTVDQYIQYLREHGVSVAVTASTGIAATHLGGMTIHSWSGIGIKKELSDRDLAALHGKNRLVSRTRKTNVLIIDEISMLEARVLSAVDRALRTLRENNSPFGGLQVVFVGDFFQLPPVSGNEPVQFAFASFSWVDAQPVVCYLSEQHRQEDARFTDLLNAIRSGDSFSQDYDLLLTREVSINITGAMTRLYTHNADVDRINNMRLAALPEEEHTFNMESQGITALVDQLKKGCLSPETLLLKKGAQVMFTKNNYEMGFVNGTLGEVVGFNDELPAVKTKQGRIISVMPMEWSIEEDGRSLARIIQIPLRLAWAITVHKSQGMTLDTAVVDLSNAFEYGQGYVAISRVRSLSGLFLLGLNKRALQVHPEIAEIDTVFRNESYKAVQALDLYSETDLVKKHENFIRRSGGSINKVKPAKNISTYDQTLALFKERKGISEIAHVRELKEGTIISHLEKLRANKKIEKEEIERVIPSRLKKELPKIHRVFAAFDDDKLFPVFQKLNGAYSYDDLRLARMVMDK